MKQNVGTTDKIIRIALGLAIALPATITKAGGAFSYSALGYRFCWYMPIV